MRHEFCSLYYMDGIVVRQKVAKFFVFAYIGEHMELLKHALPWIQIILSVVLIGLILLQRSGAELGGAFGGGDTGGTLYTRRGFEKVLFFATIVCALLFIALNLAALFLGK